MNKEQLILNRRCKKMSKNVQKLIKVGNEINALLKLVGSLNIRSCKKYHILLKKHAKIANDISKLGTKRSNTK